jgi:hypothetical protein
MAREIQMKVYVLAMTRAATLGGLNTPLSLK